MATFTLKRTSNLNFSSFFLDDYIKKSYSEKEFKEGLLNRYQEVQGLFFSNIPEDRQDIVEYALNLDNCYANYKVKTNAVCKVKDVNFLLNIIENNLLEYKSDYFIIETLNQIKNLGGEIPISFFEKNIDNGYMDSRFFKFIPDERQDLFLSIFENTINRVDRLEFKSSSKFTVIDIFEKFAGFENSYELYVKLFEICDVAANKSWNFFSGKRDSKYVNLIVELIKRFSDNESLTCKKTQDLFVAKAFSILDDSFKYVLSFSSKKSELDFLTVKSYSDLVVNTQYFSSIKQAICYFCNSIFLILLRFLSIYDRMDLVIHIPYIKSKNKYAKNNLKDIMISILKNKILFAVEKDLIIRYAKQNPRSKIAKIKMEIFLESFL